MGVKLQSSSGGSVEIAAPVTASNYVLTAPAANGTILNDVSSLAAAMLTGNVDVARLVSAFSGSNVSLGANGYQKLPSGLIIQWGFITNSASADTTVTFPIAFPNAVASVVVTADGTGGGIFGTINSRTLSNFKYAAWVNATTRAGVTVNYFVATGW